LVGRVQKRFALSLSSSSTENLFPESCNSQLASCTLQPVPSLSAPHTRNADDQRLTTNASCNPQPEIRNPKPATVLEISLNRPDRIIFEGKEVKVTVQITFHLYKIRRVILKTIGNNKKNEKKVKDILKVISRRGIMLNLAEDKLKIN